jgi:NADH-quinone oxidoreductase subunit E
MKPQGFTSAPAKRDDLAQLHGVDKATATKLNSIGIYTFQQMATWGKANMDWVDAYLKVGGRVAHEDWVGQAALLMLGGDHDHSTQNEALKKV